MGTGNAGKVLKIDRKGAVTELFAAPEPEVFAVWADPDGTVYAGTSPNGKVYRIPPAKGQAPRRASSSIPRQTYIWALARAADGGLLVGTGTEGKLFRVDAKGKGERCSTTATTPTSARSRRCPGGDVLAGTAGEGLILRVGRDGRARTLFDAQGPEVVSLAAAPDGTCYAAVIASEASLVDQARDQARPSAAAAPGAGEAGRRRQPQVSVTVEQVEQPPPPAGRRPGRGRRRRRAARCSRSRRPASWRASGASPTIRSTTCSGRTARLWVATGLEGKLYRWADQQMILEKDVDERQIVAVLPGEPGPAFATTNAAALYRVTAGTERTGTYTSAGARRRAGGALRHLLLGRATCRPGRRGPRFSFRSGVSAEPDRTWSAWTEPREGPGDPAERAAPRALRAVAGRAAGGRRRLAPDLRDASSPTARRT